MYFGRGDLAKLFKNGILVSVQHNRDWYGIRDGITDSWMNYCKSMKVS